MAAESKTERALVRYCREHDILCYKFVSPSHRGVPDRLLIGPTGKVLFLELKAPGKHPSALQFRELELLRAHGTTAFWAWNAEDAIAMARRVL